jgi:hypothetical protein
MTQMEASQSPAEGPFSSPIEGSRPRVKPYTVDFLGKLKVNICKGMHPTTAACAAGVPKSTFSQWMQEWPELLDFIDQAKGELIAEKLDILSKCKNKHGEPDPGPIMWLLGKVDKYFAEKQTVDHNITGEILHKAIDPNAAKSLQDRRSKLALCQEAIEVEPVKQPDSSP